LPGRPRFGQTARPARNNFRKREDGGGFESGWHDNYDGAPADGWAWIDGGDVDRVVRGGSWDGYARYMRAACRNQGNPADRDYDASFRCAQIQ
jgi:formylglycine-generating enzyme required for sulfatase activity